MKITELMAELGRQYRLHGDLEVKGAWEGITNPIWNVYRGRQDDSEEYAVLLDVDIYAYDSYRAAFEHPEDRA